MIGIYILCQLLAYDWCTDNSTTDIGPIISRVVKLGKPYLGYQLIYSEEALHTIMIELHLQVSSFNHVITFFYNEH